MGSCGRCLHRKVDLPPNGSGHRRMLRPSVVCHVGMSAGCASTCCGSEVVGRWVLVWQGCGVGPSGRGGQPQQRAVPLAPRPLQARGVGVLGPDEGLADSSQLSGPSMSMSMIGFARRPGTALSLIHISEPTRLGMISYAVFC